MIKIPDKPKKKKQIKNKNHRIKWNFKNKTSRFILIKVLNIFFKSKGITFIQACDEIYKWALKFIISLKHENIENIT